MTQHTPVNTNDILTEVRYEIRGELAHRAGELERMGYEIIQLNIGNPGLFGYRTPETMRLAMIENLAASEAYCHQKGIFPAREAVVMQQQDRGVMDVTADDVFIGNGVSELIDLALRAMLRQGDEVLVPSPDYPLWSAAVSLNRGHPVFYDCRPENGFQPDPDEIESRVTPRTRAIVLINPNNPTGAVYDKETLASIARMAEKHGLVVFSDEIYDAMLYEDAVHIPMATLVHDTLCVTFSGLSKIYRSCGYRVGWAVFSGERDHAQDYLHAMELLASLRLCANVPGQWAVQTALGGYQSIQQFLVPGGRLYEQRNAAWEMLNAIDGVSCVKPKGALYLFPKLDVRKFNITSDERFVLDLLRQERILVVQGTGFNWFDPDHFRIVFLPREEDLRHALERLEHFLAGYRQ